MTGITLVLALLACWRLGRLIAVDEIARPLRERLADRDRIAYLISCPWCASIYSSIPVAVAVAWWPDNRAVLAVLLVLAGSLASGFGVTVEDRLDR